VNAAWERQELRTFDALPHHNRWSLMAVVANQALAFDKPCWWPCLHLGDVLRPGLILDHGKTRSFFPLKDGRPWVTGLP
jgi:hypothetical protein